MPSPARCAAHPARPAVDTCPVCGRERCGADRALAPGGGCTLCGGRTAPLRAYPAAGPTELLVRAAAVAAVLAVAGGYVNQEYVGSPIFQYLAPAVLGVLVGGGATAAAGSPRAGALLQRVRWVATLYALLGSALGILLEGTYDVLSGKTDVLLTYLISMSAAWFWTAPPRSRANSKPVATAS
jgi:hypothetical protein